MTYLFYLKLINYIIESNNLSLEKLKLINFYYIHKLAFHM